MGFFKAYDMRGTYGVDFDLDTVYRVGRALPKVVPGTRWLVGRDCRASSSAVRDALVAGLRAAGVEVVDLGLATTPMVYFFAPLGPVGFAVVTGLLAFDLGFFKLPLDAEIQKVVKGPKLNTMLAYFNQVSFLFMFSYFLLVVHAGFVEFANLYRLLINDFILL